MVNENSYQDRPTGEPPETTPIFYTATALGPAVVGSDDPNDASILYHNIGTTTAPVATTVFSFPPQVTPAQRGAIFQTTVTETTYLSTVTVTPSESVPSSSSNSSVTVPSVQKRQICSMIFASIDGQWVSWCNEWNGYTTVKYSSYTSTTVIPSPPGADPLPKSVWDPSATSETTGTSQTSSSGRPTSTTTVQPLPSVSPVSPPTTVPATSTESPSIGGVLTSEISLTATVVITYPITTISRPSVTTSASDTVASSPTAVVPLASTLTAPNTTAPSPASPSCGQVGEFLITFDNLPAFSTNQPNNETTAPPIFNPYDHFFWSAGFGYGPPPNEPFAPHDGTELAEYNPAYEPSTLNTHAQGWELPGSFGAGPRAFNSIFWFDVNSFYIGCNSTGPEAPCTVIATGYQWIASNVPNATTTAGHEQLAFVRYFSVPGSCPDKGCPLTQISFDAGTFTGLSTLNLLAYSRDEEQVGFYLDSFEGIWTNNTCAAGQQRSTSRR